MGESPSPGQVRLGTTTISFKNFKPSSHHEEAATGLQKLRSGESQNCFCGLVDFFCHLFSLPKSWPSVRCTRGWGDDAARLIMEPKVSMLTDKALQLLSMMVMMVMAVVSALDNDDSFDGTWRGGRGSEPGKQGGRRSTGLHT